MRGPQYIFFKEYRDLHKRYLTGIFALVLLFCQLPLLGQAPRVDSFSPQKGSYGEVITLKGSGFADRGSLKVSFGAAAAEIIESTPSSIKVKVPAAATYAPIAVTNLQPSGLTAYSSQPFLLSFGGRKNGEVLLETPKSYAGSGVYDVCACDLDGDGRNDMTGSNQLTTSVSTYLNAGTIGNISFPVRKEISAGIRTLHVVCGDLDGDGKPDLVYTGNATDGSKIIILRNISSRGNISFAAPKILSAAPKILARPAIQDLDGDGKPEIILSNMSDKQVAVLKNSSSPGNISFDASFLAFPVTNSSMQGLRIKDVNNDGLADITVSNLYGRKVYFLLNNSSPGNISFGEVLEFNASGLSNHELEDLDGDGKPELITLDYINNRANIYLNSSSGNTISFAAAQAIALGAGPAGLHLGDLNGDQKVDLLIGHNLEGKAFLLTNTSTEGSLSFDQQILTGAGKFTNAAISDFDGDAIPDIAIADKESLVFNVYRNSTCLYPAINPSGSVELCEGSSVTLTTFQSPAAELELPLVTYQWLKDGVALDTDAGKTNSITVSTPGSYSLRMTAPGSCSASSNAVTVKTFNESMGNPQFDGPTELCEGAPLTLSVSPAIADATYTWTNNQTGFQASSSTNTLSIEAADPARHAGSYTVRVAKGPCQTTLESPEISIYPKPAATISADGNLAICAGESRELSVEQGFQAYQWKKGGVNIPGENTASYTAQEAGTYAVVIQNSNGCETESQALSLEVNESLQAQFEAPETACLNQPVQFSDQSVVEAGKRVEYLWDFGDGTQTSQPSPVHTYSSTGSASYTVILKIQYENSHCSSTYSKVIQVMNTAAIAIEAPNGTSFCQGDSVKVQISGDVAEVNWSNGDKGIFTYGKKDGTLEANIITNSGCTLSKSIALSSLLPPDLEISSDKKVIGRGESARLQANGAVSYMWEPATGLNDPTIANPIASPEQTTTYKVVAIGEEGCMAAAEITITVDASFKIQAPKLLIPAVDESWKVSNVENYPDVSLTILNKFGNVVFKAFPYENNWNGTDRGTVLNEGIYFYVFKDASGKVLKTGSISLVR